MRRSPTLLVTLASTLLTASLLAACGGSDDATSEPSATVDGTTVETSAAPSPTTPATTVASTTSVPVDTDPPATDPPATDPPATDPPATDPLVGGGGSTGVDASTAREPVGEDDCLIGDWVVTEEQMNGFYAGLMSTLEAPLTIDTVGSAPLSFAADGTYAWAPDFVLTVELAGVSGTGETTGTITGSWTTADGVITTESDVNALEVRIEVNGVSFDGDDMANGLLNSSPVNGVTYSCDGPTPVLDFLTADPAVTVPVTLTPA